MFARLEAMFRRTRRRLSRSEWAIRHLGLEPSAGTSEKPGLLMIQIDGLARTEIEHAIAKGRMPFVRKLLRRGGYKWQTFYPGIPTTTAAVQAELFYGVRSAVPAFSFMRRDTREIGRMLYPSWAKDFEGACSSQSEGLLDGGSAWSNIYTGGADGRESHFCVATNDLGDMWQTGKIGNLFLFLLLHLPTAIRIAALLTVEAGAALWDAIAGIRRGHPVANELSVAASRVFVSTGLREVISIGASVDLARGLPVVHVNFVGYDEQAHGRGPRSVLAHLSLIGIDRAIKSLCRAAERSSRRDYSVWIYSDHGQERTRSFATEFPGGIEEAVRNCYDRARRRDPAWRPRSQRRDHGMWIGSGPWSRNALARSQAADAMTEEESSSFSVVAVGPVGHVYFAKPPDDKQRASLARRLVKEGKVPGVLLKDADGAVTWYHAHGEVAVPGEVPGFLPHASAIAKEIAKDLVDFCSNRDAGDLVLLGWSPDSEAWTFALERGAHGGIGPEETRGFALLPSRTRLPPGTNHFIRAAAMRQAALYHLGREKLVRPKRLAAQPPEPLARVMTYNIHGCSGMDGRISPRRIQRVIEREMPDIVALQEVDLGRRRSRSEDQAEMIARELGMNFEFCPTVTVDEEHYGHALLSPWPIEIVKRGRLPAAPGRRPAEPRAALWARINIAGRPVNVITTHLGLRWGEGIGQVRALLGEEWIASIPVGEPVILCGDLNLSPSSGGYRLLRGRLDDVQVSLKGHSPLNTFSTSVPFTRIDHVLVSSHFEVNEIRVLRNDLTRVASDHYPLLAELRVSVSDAEEPTTTRQAQPRHKRGETEHARA